MTAAIEVTTSTTINHWELGRDFFEWNNEEQAIFLHGAKCGHDDLGAWGHMQLSYIVDAAKEAGTLDQVREFIELLREYFKEEADA